jgi:pyruvate dehydrogenase E2 component (dihydrolipoamide acetyltransferase)
MPLPLLMPALSPTMTDGTIARWLKKEGETIQPGMVIAEIETDKATMEVEAVDQGVLGRIDVPAGTSGVAVNAVIGWLLEKGEDISALASIGTSAPASLDAAASSAVSSSETILTPSSTADAQKTMGVSDNTGSPERVKASPWARREADLQGLDLHGVTGTGPRGRIIHADVMRAVESGSAAQSASKSVSAPALGETQLRRVPHSTMRKVIARRLLESKQQIPHFYLSLECRMDRLLALRQEVNGLGGAKTSVNDWVIKACALSLRDVPEVNASWTEEAMLYYPTVDISVAVAIDGGLITPIVRSADSLSMEQISVTMKDLASRAREGKLRPEEFQGGGFSISNLGMFGIESFQAIINPPQSSILAVGATVQRPVVGDHGQIEVGSMLSVSLSCDHRVVDGATAARFLQAVKLYLEQPLRLLVS